MTLGEYLSEKYRAETRRRFDRLGRNAVRDWKPVRASNWSRFFAEDYERIYASDGEMLHASMWVNKYDAYLRRRKLRLLIGT